MAWVYRVRCNGQARVLKLFTSVGAKDESIGSSALRYFDGQGAVRLFRSDDHAQLLEYVAGGSLLTIVQKGADGEATWIIAEVIRALHLSGKDISVENLIPLRRWYRTLLETRDVIHEERNLFEDASSIAEELLTHPIDEVVLHGDIHHENILHSDRGWLAIDPKGLFGERTYEAANTLFNPVAIPELVQRKSRLELTAKQLVDTLNLDYRRFLLFSFTYGCLSALWTLNEGRDPKTTLSVARTIRSMI